MHDTETPLIQLLVKQECLTVLIEIYVIENVYLFINIYSLRIFKTAVCSIFFSQKVPDLEIHLYSGGGGRIQGKEDWSK